MGEFGGSCDPLPAWGRLRIGIFGNSTCHGLQLFVLGYQSSVGSDKFRIPVGKIQHNKGRIIIYGFMDASGTGGGASFERQVHEQNLSYIVSVWSADKRQESSNWREFSKLVQALEEESKDDGLKKSVIFMFTDNSTVESAIHSGRSKSPKLRSLVVRFYALQTINDCSIEVFHVAGTRMIAQGTDGISRGALNEGILDGRSMLSFVPIHQSALERSPMVLAWLYDWLPGSPKILQPIDWFQSGQGISGYTRDFENSVVPQFWEDSVFVWTPPPYAADVAIAELRKSRTKRMNHLHVFVCPRLCTTKWRRHFFKAADIVFEIPPFLACWPSQMHEPLIIGISFPFLRCAPWQLRGTPRMYEVARKVRALCKGDKLDPGDFLRQFCKDCLRLRSMPEHLVRRMLYFESGP